MPEPAAEPEPASITAAATDKVTERNTTPEPELDDATDQGCEPATLCIAVGLLVEIVGLEGSPAHTPAAEGELQLTCSWQYYEELLDCFNQEDLIDWFGKIITSSPMSPLFPPSSPVCPSSSPMAPGSRLFPLSSPGSQLALSSSLVPPKLHVTPKVPPSLPLMPPLIPASSSDLSPLHGGCQSLSSLQSVTVLLVCPGWPPDVSVCWAHGLLFVVGSGGQSTQIKYLSKSTDTYSKIQKVQK